MPEYEVGEVVGFVGCDLTLLDLGALVTILEIREDRQTARVRFPPGSTYNLGEGSFENCISQIVSLESLKRPHINLQTEE